MFQNLQGTFHQTAPAAARRAHQPPGPGGLRLARGGAEKLQADPRPHLAFAGKSVVELREAIVVRVPSLIRTSDQSIFRTFLSFGRGVSYICLPEIYPILNLVSLFAILVYFRSCICTRMLDPVVDCSNFSACLLNFISLFTSPLSTRGLFELRVLRRNSDGH